MGKRWGTSVTVSPLGAVVRGVVAGAAGTVALDAVNYAQYRALGGRDDAFTWEFSAGLDSWDKAPAPAHIGKRMYEALRQRELPDSSARTVKNVTHWAYGMFWGAVFGVVASSTRPRRLRGPLFGSVVWLSAYTALPVAKLHKPTSYSQMAKDWAVHSVFGTATSVAFTILSRQGARQG